MDRSLRRKIDRITDVLWAGGTPVSERRADPRNGRLPMPDEGSCVRSLFDVARVDPARSRRGGAPVAIVVFRKTVE